MSGHNKFRVELPALREFGDYAQAEIPNTPGPEKLQGKPVFGRRDQAGPRVLAEKHAMALREMQQLAADIKGGMAATEAGIHEVATNYKKADDNARARMNEVNAAMDDWEKPQSRRRPPDQQGQQGQQPQPSPSPSPAPDGGNDATSPYR